jgi:hypothetical protein
VNLFNTPFYKSIILFCLFPISYHGPNRENWKEIHLIQSLANIHGTHDCKINVKIFWYRFWIQFESSFNFCHETQPSSLKFTVILSLISVTTYLLLIRKVTIPREKNWHFCCILRKVIMKSENNFDKFWMLDFGENLLFCGWVKLYVAHRVWIIFKGEPKRVQWHEQRPKKIKPELTHINILLHVSKNSIKYRRILTPKLSSIHTFTTF